MTPEWPDVGSGPQVLDSSAAASAAALTETRRWFVENSGRQERGSDATAEHTSCAQRVKDGEPSTAVTARADAAPAPVEAARQHAPAQSPRPSLALPPDLLLCPITQVRCDVENADTSHAASCRFRAVQWSSATYDALRRTGAHGTPSHSRRWFQL